MAKKVKFQIQGMHCQSCATLIENALKDRAGVSMSKVNHESGKAVVIYDEDKISQSEIKKTIEQTGDYQVAEDNESADADAGDPINSDGKTPSQNSKSPKFMFAVGIITGLAIFGLINLFVQAGNNRSEQNSNPASPPTAADNQNNDTPPPSAPAKVDLAISKDDNILGSQNAPITIVEFSDFQCPFCARFHDTMKQVAANYQGKVRWVYKHFPLDSIHPFARKAAEASECAAEQNKFWEYSDEIFANQSSLGLDYLKTAAKNIGLNASQFNQCLDDEKYKNLVQQNYQEGISAGVQGTPGSFLNGQALGGAVPYNSLAGIIDGILNQ